MGVLADGLYLRLNLVVFERLYAHPARSDPVQAATAGSDPNIPFAVLGQAQDG